MVPSQSDFYQRDSTASTLLVCFFTWCHFIRNISPIFCIIVSFGVETTNVTWLCFRCLCIWLHIPPQLYFCILMKRAITVNTSLAFPLWPHPLSSLEWEYFFDSVAPTQLVFILPLLFCVDHSCYCTCISHSPNFSSVLYYQAWKPSQPPLPFLV